MALVKVKTKYQVTLPTAVREKAGVAVGDLLEARAEGKKITLTPKNLIDWQIAESMEDYRKGRSYGPFDTAEEMIASLRTNLKRRARKTSRSR